MLRKEREIHLHDAERRYYADSVQLLIDHQPIGRGVLDFDPFFAALGEIGFQGSIILEIDDRWPVATSVQRVRRLIGSHLGWCRPPLVFAGEMVAVHE